MSRITVSPNTYRKIATWALIMLTLIIFTGAAVRLTGSGLGCPDWPKCYGKSTPPLETHAIIEFGNRMLSGLVGIATIFAALFAWLRRPFRRDLAMLGLLLPLGVVAQAVLGGFTVRYHLAPGFVMGHFGLSMLILIAAVALTWRARDTSRDRESTVSGSNSSDSSLSRLSITSDFNQSSLSNASSDSSPITSSPITSNPITSSPITSNPITSNPITSNPITSNPITSNPITSNPITSGSDQSRLSNASDFSLSSLKSDAAALPEVRKDRIAIWSTRALLPIGAVAIFFGTAATASGPHAGGKGTGDVILRLRWKGDDTLNWAIHQHAMFVVALVLTALAALVIAYRRQAPKQHKSSLVIVCLLLVFQATIGITQYALKLPAELVWIHVCTATLIWIAILWATASAGSLRASSELSDGNSRSDEGQKSNERKLTVGSL